jgi:hypothetical protein
MIIRISEEEYAELSEENGGYCLACGEVAYGVEPDARKYTCESCDSPSVYGIEELLIMGKIEFGESDD